MTDPVVLGVKPATAEPGTQAPWTPPYVPREVDNRLDEALAFNRFVLLVGDSAAGKSRTAFEAMRRRYPDRALVLPARPDSLATLLDAGLEFHDAVVWLDDLDAYLGTGALALVDLERLLGPGDRGVIVLATIRKAAYDRFDQDAAIPERKLLRAATQLPLHRPLTRAEQHAAEQVAAGNKHLRAVLDRLDWGGGHGLAEYLAAVPELIRRFDHADDVDGNPVGAAVVRAAIDWRRVGLTRPVPIEVLRALCPLYLSPEETRRLDDTTFAQAMAWATKRVVASSGLLAEEPGGYRVFDYLLDYVERDARFLLPPKLLESLRELVTPGEARRVGLALADAYRQTGQDAALVAGRDIIVVGDNVGRDQINIQASRDVSIIADPSAVMLGAAGLLLPPDITVFTGRAEVLEAAQTALAEHRAVALIGLGGIGKTAIAVHLAHRLHDSGEFPDSPVYVNLRGTEGQPADAVDVLADLLAALGVPGRELRGATSAQLAGLYRKVMTDRRMVIVLDNAASADQVAPLLPPAPNVALLTSRNAAAFLRGAFSVMVDPLTPPEAMMMLDRLVTSNRVNREPAAAREIVARCGYLPLAIRIAGARLREHPRWSLASFAERLRDQNLRLDELSSHGVEVRASFALAYQGLSDEQARAFRLLGLLPTRRVDAEQVAALLHGTVEHAWKLLEALVDAGLLNLADRRSGRADRYEMHDLLHLFAREQAEAVESEEDRRQAILRVQTSSGDA